MCIFWMSRGRRIRMTSRLSLGKFRMALLTPMFSAWVGLPPTASSRRRRHSPRGEPTPSQPGIVTCGYAFPASQPRSSESLLRSWRQYALQSAPRQLLENTSILALSLMYIGTIILQNFLVTARQRCLFVEVPFLNIVSWHGQVIDGWI